MADTTQAQVARDGRVLMARKGAAPRQRVRLRKRVEAEAVTRAAADAAFEAALAGKGAVLVGTATIAESGLTTTVLSVRRVAVAVTGVVTTGNYLAFPVAATPAGYGIADAVCGADGTLTFGVMVPVLTAGSYSIDVRVVRVLT